jgi:hypothetical protein
MNLRKHNLHPNPRPTIPGSLCVPVRQYESCHSGLLAAVELNFHLPECRSGTHEEDCGHSHHISAHLVVVVCRVQSI